MNNIIKKYIGKSKPDDGFRPDGNRGAAMTSCSDDTLSRHQYRQDQGGSARLVTHS